MEDLIGFLESSIDSERRAAENSSSVKIDDLHAKLDSIGVEQIKINNQRQQQLEQLSELENQGGQVNFLNSPKQWSTVRKTELLHDSSF